ncbi:MAG: hypothetical protein K1X68_03500 [Saprospiraceae bacterium]|nr:hypothetical protein [Saprospiraceae bacterium]HMW38722.1 hypothetical protein [Saprospiraceae bacterium]HMX88620.1 hypothetical protein [Saprospiraceae bacterium]HMZ40200.1 hypothetical protein [Saprospiraceae bacterium]HNA63622.1 hypothetical protein [Saprospiraceae bacterium]
MKSTYFLIWILLPLTLIHTYLISQPYLIVAPRANQFISATGDMLCNAAGPIEARITAVVQTSISSKEVSITFEVRRTDGNPFTRGGSIAIDSRQISACPGSVPPPTTGRIGFSTIPIGARTISCIAKCIIKPCGPNGNDLLCDHCAGQDALFKAYVYFIPAELNSPKAYAGPFLIRNTSTLSAFPQPNLAFSPLGDTTSLMAVSCQEWQIESPVNWIKFNGSRSLSGQGNHSTIPGAGERIPIQINPNITKLNRSAILRLSNGISTQNITIQQDKSKFNCTAASSIPSGINNYTLSSGKNNANAYAAIDPTTAAQLDRIIPGLESQKLNGNEKIFKYNHRGGDFNLTLSNSSETIVALVLKTCDQSSVVTGRIGNGIINNKLITGTYYIVIDAKTDAPNRFSLKVSSN